MDRASPIPSGAPRLEPAALIELLKPVTWFPPMWAFACGVVSSGADVLAQPGLLVAGVLLSGPLVCGASQIVNDWFDRHVDAINEPNRPIPSGRVPGQIGLWYAIGWSALALAWGTALGPWVGWATLLGLVLAWAYSAPPLRLKRNGWWGNSAVGISYEGLAWVSGAAVMLGGQMPALPILVLALLYSIGAHGIMTLNDFKSIDGDRRMSLRSLPVILGPERAARFACVVMAVPQLAVIALLFHWDRPWHGLAVAVVLVGQLLAMVRMLRDPRGLAPWYNATGVTLYVSGMMISAVALRAIL